MDNLERAMVSLLIDEDDLVPEEISALLGVAPDIGVRKGESFLSSWGPRPRPTTAKTGRWKLTSGWRTNPDIDELIKEVLGRVPDSPAVWDELTTKFHCYISVGLHFTDWTGGMLLQPETLRAVGERGLTLDFDMYAPAASS